MTCPGFEGSADTGIVEVRTPSSGACSSVAYTWIVPPAVACSGSICWSTPLSLKTTLVSGWEVESSYNVSYHLKIACNEP